MGRFSDCFPQYFCDWPMERLLTFMNYLRTLYSSCALTLKLFSWGLLCTESYYWYIRILFDFFTPFIPFSCLIAPANTSRRCGESRHPCMIFILVRMLRGFPVNVMLVDSLWYIAPNVSFSTCLSRKMLDLVKVLFCIYCY